MRFGKILIPLIIAALAMQGLQAGSIDVEDNLDFKLAMGYVNGTTAVDTIILVTSGGVYTTTDTSYFPILLPLTIMAAPGLAEKPILTHSDADSNELEIFRIFNDFAVDGVIFDGGHARSHGMKYALRFGHEDKLAPNNVSQKAKVGSNITVTNCDFRDFYVDKDPGLDGHAIAFLRPEADGFSNTDTLDVIKAGDVLFENCTFENFGYEAIRISETEKYTVDSPVASLTVRNCTFTNIDAECVRYYSDTYASTPDAPVLIEHLTINNSATRVMFLKNSGGAIVRDIIISNSRTSGHGRDDDLLDAQGNTGVPSFVSHIDTFNVNAQPIESADGEIDLNTIYGFDPMYVDAANKDYTLADGSPVYGLGHDGSALGDLRWATGSGPASVVDGASMSPEGFILGQNYPNPFNPTTTIDFSLDEAGWTTLEVYNLLGQRLATLVAADYQPGNYSITFSGANIPSGLYFYRLQQRDFSSIHKMVLLK